MCLSLVLAGCETDGFFDPTKVGYYQRTPSTMPILSRLDVVERETTGWGQVSAPTPDDLQPGELQYRLSAGDEIRVEVFELISQGQTEQMLRTVDPSGNIRLPTIGEVPAAGLTIAQVQRSLEDRLKALIAEPLVSVILERGQGFTFVIYGAVQGTGVYGLTRPDFRLLEAVALAGGTFSVTKKIFVIRSRPLDDSLNASYRDRGMGKPNPIVPDTTGDVGGGKTAPAVDINDLIQKLEPSKGSTSPTTPPSTAPPVGSDKPAGTLGMVSGKFQDAAGQAKPPIDVDELKTPAPTGTTAVAPTTAGQSNGEGWMWDAQRQEWVRGTAAPAPSLTAPARPLDRPTGTNMYATRIMEIDYQALAKGESNFNVIIRPGDQIFVQPPLEGLVVIGGEINRPGVYELPSNGELTLSRLVDVAGGFTQIAIPQRVDLIRRVGPMREAAIRINLAAIRARSEPDIALKPDDHVIVGTNFFATPLAVIRNGFRMTYGFGFLIDRNFGNDVFGPPPESLGVSRN